MSRFENYKEQSQSLKGWFNPESQAIWDCLLGWQESKKIAGNMMEIGVYHGKSALLMAHHASENETCLYVDPILNEQTCARLNSAHAGGPEKNEFIKAISEPLDHPQFLAKWQKSFRWFHIDGEHTGMAVATDLKIADALLHRQGILSLDDFLSPAYPQITQAVFHYLAQNPTRLCLVLCGFNKGYLCRPYTAPILRKYIYETLQADLKNRLTAEFTVWHSTMPDDLNCFGITHREKEHGTYRGPDWMPDQVIF
jgi:predicted O-methyltransferase YrrM